MNFCVGQFMKDVFFEASMGVMVAFELIKKGFIAFKSGKTRLCTRMKAVLGKNEHIRIRNAIIYAPFAREPISTPASTFLWPLKATIV
ncbi:MAG: hypothetical protein CENE_01221 [Candidatus Celerinatantimonas neptuna]|nr:MAG: hypothetical protein CENE_01221 [Candidatus Celerinatantimonas neptuna]